MWFEVDEAGRVWIVRASKHGRSMDDALLDE